MISAGCVRCDHGDEVFGGNNITMFTIIVKTMLSVPVPVTLCCFVWTMFSVWVLFLCFAWPLCVKHIFSLILYIKNSLFIIPWSMWSPGQFWYPHEFWHSSSCTHVPCGVFKLKEENSWESLSLKSLPYCMHYQYNLFRCSLIPSKFV